MSRSNQTEFLPNPASKIITLSGKTGKFEYWDKNLKSKVSLEYPIKFLILDILGCVTGYNDANQTQYYSNEIHDTKKEQFTVRMFKNKDRITGFWDDIKGSVVGGRFTASVYALMYDKDKKAEIVRFHLVGASLSPFIELRNNNKRTIYKGAVSITHSIPAKKGTNEYFVPVFKLIKEVSDESEKLAVDLDKQVQAYFSQFKDEVVEQHEFREAIDEQMDNIDDGFENQPPPVFEDDEGVPF